MADHNMVVIDSTPLKYAEVNNLFIATNATRPNVVVRVRGCIVPIRAT